jgi:hypothetical protein
MAYDCLRILGSTLDPPPLMCLQYALLFGRSVRSDPIPGPGSLVGDRAFVVSRARPPQTDGRGPQRPGAHIRRNTRVRSIRIRGSRSRRGYVTGGAGVYAGKLPRISFYSAMHYSPDHERLLPSGIGALPMPDTRLEALWLFLCLEERRRMLPCQAGPPEPTGSPEGAGGPRRGRCFRAADHAQQGRVGSYDPLGS